MARVVAASAVSGLSPTSPARARAPHGTPRCQVAGPRARRRRQIADSRRTRSGGLPDRHQRVPGSACRAARVPGGACRAARGPGGVGRAVVAQVWEGFILDPLGVAAAVAAMLALVMHFLSADAQVRGPYRRDPVSLTLRSMGAAALFRAVVQPWWKYPWSSLGGTTFVEGTGATAWPVPLLVGYVVMLGTVVPFSFVVLSLRHLRASQASVVGMTEPTLATAMAWVVLLGEVLTPARASAPPKTETTHPGEGGGASSVLRPKPCGSPAAATVVLAWGRRPVRLGQS